MVLGSIASVSSVISVVGYEPPPPPPPPQVQEPYFSAPDITALNGSGNGFRLVTATIPLTNWTINPPERCIQVRHFSQIIYQGIATPYSTATPYYCKVTIGTGYGYSPVSFTQNIANMTPGTYTVTFACIRLSAIQNTTAKLKASVQLGLTTTNVTEITVNNAWQDRSAANLNVTSNGTIPLTIQLFLSNTNEANSLHGGAITNVRIVKN